ncbi:hypothetical protein KIH39_21945 [Telmatocola sphagniphila]|uniref:HTTM domain-containing protein n=1 Tax=Telmatocola sphagniphila TaxID=1123043 RepID=A0A8E6EXN8_9BACT|nr:hypothetical protein [Telmatocola sphagniphila]QVL31481.1 hypothetical protein KIH39_21945 [Telmatocola sphagniphila]
MNWLQPENLEFKILRDAMNPLFFSEFRNPAIWLHRHDVPIFSYSLIGIFTVSAELSYIAIFFSKWARVVIPILIFSLHTGILVFQRILFLDLMILQLIFINANWLALWARRNKEIPPDSDNFIRISKLEHRSETACPKQRLRLLAFIVISAGISAVWIYRIERFPLSAWQMYSDVQARMPIVYFKVMATRENGEIEEVDSHLFCRSVMINSYMMLIPSLNSERMSTLTEVITNYIEKSNKASPPESRIKCIEIEKWNWDYWEDPKNPNCGKIVNSYAFYAK